MSYIFDTRSPNASLETISATADWMSTEVKRVFISYRVFVEVLLMLKELHIAEVAVYSYIENGKSTAYFFYKKLEYHGSVNDSSILTIFGRKSFLF